MSNAKHMVVLKCNGHSYFLPHKAARFSVLLSDLLDTDQSEGDKHCVVPVLHLTRQECAEFAMYMAHLLPKHARFKHVRDSELARWASELFGLQPTHLHFQKLVKLHHLFDFFNVPCVLAMIEAYIKVHTEGCETLDDMVNLWIGTKFEVAALTPTQQHRVYTYLLHFHYNYKPNVE